MSQKISSFLWFDKEAREASKFYTKLFGGRVTSGENLENTPSGSVEIISIEIFGQKVTLMSAGPEFKINPSISFLVYCSSEEEIGKYWQELSRDGKALMPLNTYPFAKKFGWVEDKFGLSWQLLWSEASEKVKMSPLIMFTGDQAGKTQEAIDLYTSIFSDSKKLVAFHYDEGEGDKTEYIKHAEFLLCGQMFMAMDSGYPHKFALNEAFSFVIDCEDQKQVDYYWEKLTSGGGSESQCGWLKDKFGVSWQVVPRQLGELLAKDNSGKVMQAMLKMKKIVIEDLESAYNS